MDRAGIKFWLVDGTVLGAVREGKFILSDRDIDLRVWASDWDYPRMSKAFKDAGFGCTNTLNPKLYKDKSAGVVVIKRGIKTDICLGYHFPPKDLIVVLATTPLSNVTVLPAELFRLTEDYFVTFLGRRFRVPNPPEEYLKIRYGKVWKTPKNEKIPIACKPISIAR